MVNYSCTAYILNMASAIGVPDCFTGSIYMFLRCDFFFEKILACFKLFGCRLQFSRLIYLMACSVSF